MSPAATSSTRPEGRSKPTRIGEARPSHLVTTTGVGAVVDLPSMSVIVRGLDAWSAVHQTTVHEPRLLAKVQEVLGPQTRALRKAPWDAQESDSPWTRVGVPTTTFPGWVRCPVCSTVGPINEGGQFDLVHRWGRRPDLAKYVHAQCARQQQTAVTNRRPCVPARFLVVCEEGHVDDFPYIPFVHRTSTSPCPGPRLEMRDAASTQGPDVYVKCVECDATANMQEASGRDGSARLPVCRGRHPHLQRFEPCGKSLELMVLGASNLWFSVTASALHLPSGNTTEQIVADNWLVLGTQASPDVVQALIAGMDQLRALRDTSINEVWAVIEQLRAIGGPRQPDPEEDLLDAEWRLLSHPTTTDRDDDFHAEPTDVPTAYARLLRQVVLVPRLREVSALLGFTRITAPERGELEPAKRVSLAHGRPSWVPAVDRRGEGIFLELSEPAVRHWAERAERTERIQALRRAYDQWRFNRGRTPDPTFPIARFTLLHTLSHLLIRQVSLECGYSSASLRERLYLGTPHQPAAGLLLSTSASDSEGTLGGLVSLGAQRHLTRLIDLAFDDAQFCSLDPLCAEHVPTAPSDALHGAACHACLFASETTCEANNRWLDRAVLIDLPSAPDLAFPLR